MMKKDHVDYRQYLEFSERLTKTRDGTKGKENRGKVKPRLYDNKSDRCSIRLYKAYLARRLEKAMDPESSFYLTCIPMERVDSIIWFYPRPNGSWIRQKTQSQREENYNKNKTSVHRDKIKHISDH